MQTKIDSPVEAVRYSPSCLCCSNRDIVKKQKDKPPGLTFQANLVEARLDWAVLITSICIIIADNSINCKTGPGNVLSSMTQETRRRGREAGYTCLEKKAQVQSPACTLKRKRGKKKLWYSKGRCSQFLTVRRTSFSDALSHILNFLILKKMIQQNICRGKKQTNDRFIHLYGNVFFNKSWVFRCRAESKEGHPLFLAISFPWLGPKEWNFSASRRVDHLSSLLIANKLNVLQTKRKAILDHNVCWGVGMGVSVCIELLTWK